MSCLLSVYSLWDMFESILNQAYPRARCIHNCMNLNCQKMGKYLGVHQKWINGQIVGYHCSEILSILKKRMALLHSTND